MSNKNLREMQIGGDHYSRLKVQPRDIIIATRVPWDIGNAIKYTARFEHKNGKQDLEKAYDYIQRMQADGTRAILNAITSHAHDKQWTEFVEQFDGATRTALDTIWSVYRDVVWNVHLARYDASRYITETNKILEAINQLHVLKYGTDIQNKE